MRSSAGWSAPISTVLRFRLSETQSPLSGHPAQSLVLAWNRRPAGLAAWLAKWQASQPKFRDWVEETIEDVPVFLRLPRSHHLQMRSVDASA